MFTPTYYGVSADVRALVEVCHVRGLPLLTDDAWGLDYSFCSRLPPSALESGADLAIGSVHKTLNGFAQTSVLSIQGDRIDAQRLELVFELEQSTSASALLLASIDAARRQFQRDGEQLLGRAIDHAHRLRAAIEELPGLDLMTETTCAGSDPRDVRRHRPRAHGVRGGRLAAAAPWHPRGGVRPPPRDGPHHLCRQCR